MTQTPGLRETAREILARYLAAAREREELLAQLRAQPVDTDAFNEINAEIDLLTVDRDDAFRRIIAGYDDHPLVRAGVLAIVLTEHAADCMSYDPDIASALTVMVAAALGAAPDAPLTEEIRSLAGVPGGDRELQADPYAPAPSPRL